MGASSCSRGWTRLKDQSYFLHRLNQAQLAQDLFPVGELPKTEVRRIAAEIGLPNAKKKDSTGICFIGERPFREFLNRYLANEPGPIKDDRGRIIGRARGPELLHPGPAQGHGHRRREGKGAPGAAASTSPGSWRARTWPPTRCMWCRATTTPGCCALPWWPTIASWVDGRRRSGGCVGAKTRYRQADAACQVDSGQRQQPSRCASASRNGP
jgi:tRNA-specific 2-thiouridylase